MSFQGYEFEALTPGGVIQKGVTQAGSLEAVHARLTSSGLTPVWIKPARSRRRHSSRRRAIGLREISIFTYQFAILVEARIPIAEGLRSIAEEETNEKLRSVIEEVASSISAGSSITEGLEPFQDIFGDVYIQTLHAAEKSGNIVKILNYLAEMLDREIEIRSQLRGALLYPISVIAMLGLAIVFLLMVVVPRFETMFASRGVDLPVPTQLLLGLSAFIMNFWWILLPLIGLLVVLGRRMQRSASGSIRIDQILGRIPVLRTLLQAAALSRFAHVFGISLESGLSLIDCLQMAGQASARPSLIQDTTRMAEQVAQGGTLTNVLPTCPYMTGFVRRLLSAGEKTADLPSMCRIIARHYDREVRYLAKNMSTLIEPLLIVALASVVLFVALAIFLPMWNMMAVVGG